MMKNTKLGRILLLLACAVLLVSLSVGATLAYLTSTKTVTNTFTVGDVKIELDEATVDTETGKAIEGAERTKTGNTEVRMVPGRLIDKDPTVTVLAGSENCYVRVKVTVDVSANFTSSDIGENSELPWSEVFEAWANGFAKGYIRHGENGIARGFNTTNWKVSEPSVEVGTINPDESTITYILTYNNGTDNIVEKNTDSNTVLPAVFTHIQVPASLDNDELAKLAGMEIKVVAEAIQAEGFKAEGLATAETMAWEAFD